VDNGRRGKGNASSRGIMRGLEAWHTAMVMAGEGVKYRFLPAILQELIAGLGMTPAEGRTEGGTAEQRTMKSVGTQSEVVWLAQAPQYQRQIPQQ